MLTIQRQRRKPARAVAPTLAPLAPDEHRWLAVARRDAAADGTFVYAVKTTGVYCRPSCGARLARRENVEYFAAPAGAERGGFRACKRCRPNEAGARNGHADAVAGACRLIERADEMPDVNALAVAAGMSPSHFHRVFKSQTGVTPKAYGSAHRARRVRDELAQSKTVTAAVYNAGFNSSGRFYSGAAKTLGMKPSTFRAGGVGMTIRYAVGRCSLGSVIVAASEAGICFIALGDDRDELARELRDRFPRADVNRGDAAFEKTLGKVIAFVERPAIGLHLPLDIRGTAFQQRVWQKLAEIPCGRTRTYREIAAELGAPGATRAVAKACGDNPIAVAIPCHRVVRSDGELAGYRWGLARKAKLLQRERDPKSRR